jgi:nucleoside-diphosphate-sugar epimerase
MRVFVAGATGALGARLVPQLVERGHTVVGTSRSPERADRVRAQGAEAVVLDVLEPRAVREAVAAARPDAIVHQATALAGVADFKNFDRSFALTNRLRTDGTDALLAAAGESGVGRFVAQSFAGWPYVREGGVVKTEEDPLDPAPVPTMRETLRAIRHLERAVVAAGGTVLRYGGFYGSPEDAQVELVRKRRFPIVGDGGGIMSFVHLDDAAAATVLAVERGAAGIYNVVDDEPAPVREWLPALAAAIGAKPPRRVPRRLARLLAGEAAVVLMTEARGASNAKAKRELGWSLRHPSWRRGFMETYASGGGSERGARRAGLPRPTGPRSAGEQDLLARRRHVA